jgi:hypothetical protein
LEIQQAGKYIIDMRKAGSAGLPDPYLILLDSNQRIVASDDDSGGGLDASINGVNLQPGTYYVLASSYLTDRLGQYNLSVSQAFADQARPRPGPGGIDLLNVPEGTGLPGGPSNGGMGGPGGPGNGGPRGPNTQGPGGSGGQGMGGGRGIGTGAPFEDRQIWWIGRNPTTGTFSVSFTDPDMPSVQNGPIALIRSGFTELIAGPVTFTEATAFMKSVKAPGW